MFARVEPEVKNQAEAILNELGIPMSNAIGIVLKQVILQRGLPFEVKLPSSAPLAFGSLSEKQFNAEIEASFNAYRAGEHQDAAEAFADIERDIGL